MNTSANIVSLRDLTKIYGEGDTRVVALDSVNVDFGRGQFTAIMGPSGSGKSTMLHMLAGLDHPTSGTVSIENQVITSLKDDALTAVRRDRIGFVFQSFNLVPTLNAHDNITLPLRLAGQKVDEEWFNGIVSILGLSERLTHRPSELSGGQQQRVAVARVLAGLDNPTSGHIFIEDTDITTLKDDALTVLRRDRIGFIFQAFNLVPTLSAQDNIELPLRLAGKSPDREWIDGIVGVLGLTDRLAHLPSEMSGGQQQRVAVARALATKPAVIVADEPTGNLDSHSSKEVLSLLRASVDELGQSVIMVTHDGASAAIADRVLVVRDGQIVADLDTPSEMSIAEALR